MPTEAARIAEASKVATSAVVLVPVGTVAVVEVSDDEAMPEVLAPEVLVVDVDVRDEVDAVDEVLALVVVAEVEPVMLAVVVSAAHGPEARVDALSKSETAGFKEV